MDEALRIFGAVVAALDDEIDWELLGNACCEGDGSGFFDAELRRSIVDTGLLFADDVGRALAGSNGRSIYLGAEIAELPLILAERLVLGRQVDWLNLESPQTRELARVLGLLGARFSVELPAPCAHPLEALPPACADHLWMASVLTDPDAFPALHDALYERSGGPLATGRGSLDDERRRAEALVEALLDRAAPRCVLSTTDEERLVVEPLVARRGWTLEFARGGRLSAIVGDRVRIGTLRRAP